MTLHQLKIGNINCAILQEGNSQMTVESVAARYPNAEPGAVAAALGDQPPSGSLNLLYLNTDNTHILADVGFGDAGPSNMGGVLRGLKTLGIAPADIDIIYLTHFHGDHIAGLTNADGSLAYPSARYVTTQAEWDEWIARWTASNSDQDQRNLEGFTALQDRFTFVNDGDEVAPGVTVVNLEGHTLGHLAWHFGFDSDGALAERTRRRVLQQCADDDLLTLFYHLDFPGLGKVSQDGETFTFHPMA